jgi:2',3'-cyclic-nucleotide 2'-phosphodiesterase (5'-nucleotidase family)
MRRSYISILSILFLFSCSPHLSVHQINTQNIVVDAQSGSIDSIVFAFVKPYRDSIENDMSKLVAVTASPMIKDKPESKLTNLVADIILESASDHCTSKKLNVKPDLSYVNYGGLRASLPQGNVTVGRIFELMPFENEIVLVKISGQSVQKMADRIAARGGEGVAGLKLGIRNEKAETLLIGGKTIDRTASYWVVTNDYIANGGDQMSMFSDPEMRIDTRMKIRDVLIQSLSERYKKNGIIDVKEDGRIYHEQ